ncbi:cache domain-containing protein [Sulfurospirillum diekertiae]|uniref:Methyl-accepting chemotaxis protein PctC n=1 Tax=Sulfurospirillum diekertiae TaxID=1854492 RepID=A0A1Y0HLE6_9BACT|nr:cache domain-containing protein [Sulfurospirillum diekertiae]ARU48063.1 Methyl-accepting chemotaxis protein PctC [Sulfurospirillum diekertiae]ASC92909.1 Methyl-accepting chemotaxis protein PctC [Sulfurospirillum diekertiae]
MNYFKRKYLSTILFILVFFFLTFAYIVLVFINYDANKTMMQELVKTNQLNIVKGYKRQIDEWLSVKKRIVSSASTFLEKLDPKKNYHDIRQILQSAITTGEFRSVYIGYANDSFITGINWIAPLNYFPTERPWYKVGKERQSIAITLPYIDSDLLKEVVSIVSPIYNHNNGELMAVLSSDLILDSIQKEILSINLPFNGFAFLVSKNGKILVSPDGFSEQKCNGCEPAISAILSNNEMVGTTTYGYNGKKYLVFYEPLENSDWIFATVLNEESIFGELNEQLFQNVIMAVSFSVFGILGLLLFLFLSRKIFEHKRLLDSFAHSSSHAMAIIDKHKNVLLINDPLRKLLAINESIELGDSITQLKEIAGNIELLQTLIEAVHEVMDCTFNAKIIKIPNNDTTECLLVQIMPIIEKGSKIEGCILTINDITNEYRLETHAKEHEQIMIQHSKMAAMGEMVGAITHQWRQPLAALLVLMGMLRIQVKDKIISEDRLIESFDKAVEIVKFMELTLQAFKSFYKTGQEKEYFDSATVVEEVVSIMKPIARIHNIDLSFIYDYKKDYPMFSYSNYVKQILVNLISNAKDAILEKNSTSAEGHIIITLDETSECYVIRVEDDGVGIQKGFEEKLFKEMQTTKGHKGTGHGLYLCKLLIENKLNGTIKIISYANPTVFELTFLKEING